jgi:hypothetical protein
LPVATHPTVVREFAFELALCAHLEAESDWLPARQLGGAVAAPGSRVVDVVGLAPGPAFDDRAAITSETIPPLAVESRVPVGEAVYWRDAFDCHPEHAREVTDRACEVGFFERERRGTREYVRRTVRYPADWFGDLVAVENKPDLGTPGDLDRQLRLDTALGLFDRVVLATESYVTGAHLNRLPEAVGVWRFDPETGEREVVREPTPLDPTVFGVEPVAEHPGRTEVAFVSPEQKAQKRRRIAERAYGKGWRTYDLPGCASAAVTDDGRPHCRHFDRVVDPASECGATCPGFEAADPPTCDGRALRAERTCWVADPPGVVRRQSGLDRWV